jgi:hypothetical protein
MAHNVPVVNDGLPARISKTVGFAGLANCAGVRRGDGAMRNDLAERKPSRFSGEAFTILLGDVVLFYQLIFTIIQILF